MEARSADAMYAFLKFIHVLAVIAFVGNIVTGALWKTLADLTGDPRIMAQTVATVTRLDYIITIPAIALLLVGGIGAAQVGHIPILGTGWVLWGIIMLVVSGVCFIPISISQRRMEAVARAAPFDSAAYSRLSVVWAVWGILGTLAPLVAVAIMVIKPALPAFHAS